MQLIVRVTSKWNKEGTGLSVLLKKIVRVKNRVAKKWLNSGDAVTLEDAKLINEGD